MDRKAIKAEILDACSRISAAADWLDRLCERNAPPEEIHQFLSEMNSKIHRLNELAHLFEGEVERR